jgi:hypothetical protein
MEESSGTKADLWRERIAARQASGVSIRAWCLKTGCSEHSFYWWRSRLNLQSGLARKRRRGKAQSQSIPFAEVLVGAAAQALCLRLAGGRELLLPASMAIEQVARLVGLIETHSTSSGQALP